MKDNEPAVWDNSRGSFVKQVSGSNTLEELREKLAAIEHQRWADWQRYVFDQCRHQDSGRGVGKPADLVIPSALVERWARQINTPYEQLSESEKQSDRDQVNRYWQLILSEAHRIGMEAIGGDRDYEMYGQCPNGCGMQYGCSCDSAEFRIKHEQRERLSKITGVQE